MQMPQGGIFSTIMSLTPVRGWPDWLLDPSGT